MSVQSVCIIGGGCAGLSAALYCARAELAPVVFTGDLEHKGGLLVKTSIVENYPGFPSGVLGYDLVSGMEAQAAKYGAVIVDRHIVSVELHTNPCELVGDTGETHYFRAVIIATGSTPNKLGLPDEDLYWGHGGISSCAVCDGALYKKKRIIVVGGGDSAMEEASFLTKFSDDVTLIHRGPTFRASRAMQSRVLSNPKIRVMFNTTISTLNGADGKLTSVSIVSDGRSMELPVDGLFYGLGLKPNTALFGDAIDTDKDGYIIASSSSEGATTQVLYRGKALEGVFVAGDAHDRIYRQAVVAAGDGCRAGMDAINWLSQE